MKTIILAGGKGTRIRDINQDIPKPMIEIGNKPMIWHIIKHYMKYNIKDFYLALGYKSEIIKNYFVNYHLNNSDSNISIRENKIVYPKDQKIDFNIDLIFTGHDSMTGGRLKKMQNYIKDKTFMVTYGDGISKVNIKKLISFHKKHGKIATVTAVRPTARFGELIIDKNRVNSFSEKPQVTEGWINGGFFVFNSEIFNYLSNDQTILEQDPLEKLAKENQLMAYKSEDFWMCMDTRRDFDLLQEYYYNKKGYWLSE